MSHPLPEARGSRAQPHNGKHPPPVMHPPQVGAGSGTPGAAEGPHLMLIPAKPSAGLRERLQMRILKGVTLLGAPGSRPQGCRLDPARPRGPPSRPSLGGPPPSPDPIQGMRYIPGRSRAVPGDLGGAGVGPLAVGTGRGGADAVLGGRLRQVGQLARGHARAPSRWIPECRARDDRGVAPQLLRQMAVTGWGAEGQRSCPWDWPRPPAPRRGRRGGIGGRGVKPRPTGPGL